MGFFERDPVSTFLASVVSCDKCLYPCELKENSSTHNCEKHMKELIKEKKVHIHIEWLGKKEEQ